MCLFTELMTLYWTIPSLTYSHIQLYNTYSFIRSLTHSCTRLLTDSYDTRSHFIPARTHKLIYLFIHFLTKCIHTYKAYLRSCVPTQPFLTCSMHTCLLPCLFTDSTLLQWCRQLRVSPSSEWQMATDQSACTDETRLSFDRQFYSTVRKQFRQLKETRWSLWTRGKSAQ